MRFAIDFYKLTVVPLIPRPQAITPDFPCTRMVIKSIAISISCNHSWASAILHKSQINAIESTVTVSLLLSKAVSCQLGHKSME